MPAKDLHEEPFNEGTITKLEIFENYAQAWIPTFVMKGTPTICIFDFFAGTGFDKNGMPGSPIRILNKIKDHIGNIFQKKVKIKLYLNEFEQTKYQLLKEACNEYLNKNPDVKRAIELDIRNEKSEDLFPKLISEIAQYPSLVYIDQNGIKFLSDKYLLELEKMSQTDFLYFVSSSYFWRLGDTEEFKKYVKLDLEALKNQSYSFIHRNLITQLKQKLPINTKLKLYPFSIKKGKNIFGIIFGASHPRAVEKFLDIAWKKNGTNGQANFDIDQDFKKSQLDLFGNNQLTKIDSFKDKLKEKVLLGEIKSNLEALNFVYEEGHIGKHATDALKEMKKNGEITYASSSPCVNYEKVYKEKQIIVFKTLRK